MAEYIEREALLDSLRESYYALIEICKGLDFTIDRQICNAKITTLVECIGRVKEHPTADVEPVVRCGKCKYWNYTDTDSIVNIDYGKCTNYQSPYHNEEESTGGNFCSYGERIDNK